MSEIIVKMKSDYIKIKGGEYIRDLVRCKDCIYYYDGRTQCLIHDSTGYMSEDFCSYGERVEE